MDSSLLLSLVYHAASRCGISSLPLITSIVMTSDISLACIIHCLDNVGKPATQRQCKQNNVCKELDARPSSARQPQQILLAIARLLDCMTTLCNQAIRKNMAFYAKSIVWIWEIQADVNCVCRENAQLHICGRHACCYFYSNIWQVSIGYALCTL